MGSLGRRVPAVAGILVAGLLAGCSGPDSTPASGTGTATPPATAQAPPGTGSAATSPTASAAASVPAAVTAEQTVKLPTKPQSSVTFGIQSLQVKGPVMVLRVVVTPRFSAADAAASNNQINLFRALNDTTFRPTLVDSEHLKEYSPLGGGAPWASSELATQTANGSPVLTWAYFAAPQDDISTIDVRVADFAPAFPDVPITR